MKPLLPHGQLLPGERGQRQPQRTRPAPQGSRGWRRPREGAAGPGLGGDAWAALPAPDAAVSSASPRTPRSCDKWEKDLGGGVTTGLRVQWQCAPSHRGLSGKVGCFLSHGLGVGEENSIFNGISLEI